MYTWYTKYKSVLNSHIQNNKKLLLLKKKKLHSYCFTLSIPYIEVTFYYFEYVSLKHSYTWYTWYTWYTSIHGIPVYNIVNYNLYQVTWYTSTAVIYKILM